MWSLCFIAILVTGASSAIIPTKENIVTLHLEVSNEAKKALGFPEDAYLNFTELVTKYGYAVEEHTVITEDGYITKVFRIGKNEGPPVMLMHGLIDSPDAWILPGPGRSLAYLFVDAGYDVWCANFRGSRYTRSHVTLNPDTDVKFWKFGPDEISRYDIPALIDYILRQRKVSKLSYIGHSMGCRIFYQMGAYTPDIFKKVSVMIALAPSPWATHMYSPALRKASIVGPEIEAILYTIGVQEMLGTHSVLGNFFIQFICSRADKFNRSLNEHFCAELLGNLYGPDRQQLSDELIPIIFGHIWSAASGQTVAHMGQGLQSTKFQRYDRGIKGNLKAYGTRTPPEYNPVLVTTPVAIFSGRNDWLSSIEDVETLIKKLPNLVEHYIVPRDKWNHVDHIWGKDAPVLVGGKIMEILGNYTVNYV